MKTAYLVVHGINTKKELGNAYVDGLRIILKQEGHEGDVISGTYGFIPTWAFSIPFINKLIMRPIINMMTSRIERLSAEYDNLVIVCHSNGSWITWRACESLTFGAKNIFIACSGGIIKCSYNFKKFYPNVKLVLNYCSIGDRTVHYLPRLVGKGSCGYYGFRRRPSDGRAKKADTNMSIETVWAPPDKKLSPFPIVINRRFHVSNPSHSDWVKKPKFIRHFLSDICHFLAEEK